MMSSRRNVGLIILLAASAVGAARCGAASLGTQRPRPANNSDVVAGSREEAGPLLEGKAAGVASPFRPTGENLRDAVAAHPCPEVWLTFAARPPAGDGTAALKVELPPEAKSVLRSQWEAASAANYDLESGGFSDAGSRARRSADLVNASLTAALELRKVIIDAPDGRRPISRKEADDLARFIGAAALDLARQARGHEK